MSLAAQHECTRVPVTALASCGPLLIAAEGPFVRFYHNKGQSFDFITTTRIFKAQSIHGIAVRSENLGRVIIVCWGGRLARALDITFSENRTAQKIEIDHLSFSPSLKTFDWIFDLSWGPGISSTNRLGTCAAVTAHNALLELTVDRQGHDDFAESSSLVLSICELTSSTRSILYSAHLLWDSLEHILIAAGTAFGEIIFWSWTRNPTAGPNARVHRVFLGHEGSIFGVQISKELELVPGRGRQRLLASCSDDRTIRIWDVSSTEDTVDTASVPGEDLDAQRTRHTGFSNSVFDAMSSHADCLAVGWGHVSRVWTVQFLDSQESSSSHFLLSTGEDATSRVWNLTSRTDKSKIETAAQAFDLLQASTSAYHSGKNIWSVTVSGSHLDSRQIVCGAADGKITAYPLLALSNSPHVNLKEYSLEDISPIAQGSSPLLDTQNTVPTHKSSRVADFFRSYSFIDSSTFLLTTNSGNVYLRSIHPETADNSNTSDSKLIDHLEELSGYSVCVGETSLGIGYVAGSRGGIYIYQRKTSRLQQIHTVTGKVGGLFASGPTLFVTVLGQREAQLLHIDLEGILRPTVSKQVTVRLSELGTGLIITSMTYIPTTTEADYFALGYRKGAIAIYHIPKYQTSSSTTTSSAHSCITCPEIHGKDTVTSLHFIPSKPATARGHLLSVGRDGTLAVHYLDLMDEYPSAKLVHRLALPFGTNIEGLYYHNSHLLVYGFSAIKFVLYDTTAEEEIMSIDAGGAHRSWAFQPHTIERGGGMFVWTRASSMHVFTQHGPNHQVVRPGGHGREIKAVAAATLKSADGTMKQLIATGAEDTDIKIFEYMNGEFVCRRTLRKHTTGIQHLQWSDEGDYLFSSGGCEEFYVWRVSILPGDLGVGVVCESVCAPESEHSDLRIMAFDVMRRSEKQPDPNFSEEERMAFLGDLWRRTGSYYASEKWYVMPMVYSDSTIKIYAYTPKTLKPWTVLFSGTYFTSCLTQCKFLNPATVMTTGTDGHAVFWHLPEHPYPHPTNTTSTMLNWKSPTRIHQSTSKVLISHVLLGSSRSSSTLLVSGGDDGSLAFLITAPELEAIEKNEHEKNVDLTEAYKPVYPPIILVRAHASAITACVIIECGERTFVITSGNDQWINIFEVTFRSQIASTLEALPAPTSESTASFSNSDIVSTSARSDVDPLIITRVQKIKTNVADVSSMTLLDFKEAKGDDEGYGKGDERATRVLICGVGMEVVRIAW